MSENAYSNNGYINSIRQRVFNLLDENPSLTAKPLCKLLDLPYPAYRNYVNKLRYEWKNNHKNELGSKCSFHGWRGWWYVPIGLDRVRALDVGWVASGAHNRWLLWRNELKPLIGHRVGILKTDFADNPLCAG